MKTVVNPNSIFSFPHYYNRSVWRSIKCEVGQTALAIIVCGFGTVQQTLATVLSTEITVNTHSTHKGNVYTETYINLYIVTTDVQISGENYTSDGDGTNASFPNKFH